MSNLSALHQFSTDRPPDPVSEQAKTINQQERVLQQSYQDWKAKGKASAEAEQIFATNCLCLWQRYKAQGNRQGKQGFKRVLRNLGIPERAAYKSMWAAFPTERPTSQRNVAKSLPLPRLELRTLKSLKDDGTAFQSELSGELQAIANAVAERFGVDVLFTVTLEQSPKSCPVSPDLAAAGGGPLPPSTLFSLPSSFQ